MKIFVTGGTGFVGTYLSKYFLDRGHRVTAVGTRQAHGRISHENFTYISADTTEPGPWQEALEEIDAVVNLAGRTIFTRWTDGNKRQIRDSRILTTRNLVEALPQGRPITLCSTSAVGYYGDRGDDLLTESEPAGDDFLAALGREWEAAAFRAEEKGVRVVTARFGVVLGRGGGAVDKMFPAFRMMLGGPLGSGEQWFPWIHMDDLLSATGFVLDTPRISGPVNFCAPDPVRNLELAKILGRTLKRPAVIPAPAFILRMVLGEFASTLLASQRVVPRRLLDEGFVFRFPDLESALADLA